MTCGCRCCIGKPAIRSPPARASCSISTGQGRIDLFFLGGGQIDAAANINLIGTGEWPGTGVRFPGSFGSAFMYMMVPRTILFREEHSRRVLVPSADVVSAPACHCRACSAAAMRRHW